MSVSWLWYYTRAMQVVRMGSRWSIHGIYVLFLTTACGLAIFSKYKILKREKERRAEEVRGRGEEEREGGRRGGKEGQREKWALSTRPHIRKPPCSALGGRRHLLTALAFHLFTWPASSQPLGSELTRCFLRAILLGPSDRPCWTTS